MDGWLNVVAAGLAVLGSLFGLAQYLNFRSRLHRQSDVGKAFAEVVAGLGRESPVDRLASAALVRRFFDRKSEFGQVGQPYAADAAMISAAILRSEPTGAVQKMLADGLAFAPRLRHSDLQRANLRQTYWGPKNGVPVDAAGVDFWAADLTGASFRQANLRGCQFRDATLNTTVLSGADCTGANFDRADLRDAKFDGALLAGATFRGAANIPANVRSNLDEEEAYASKEPVPIPEPEAHAGPQRHALFVSAPSEMDEPDLLALDQILVAVASSGWTVVRQLPEDYGRANPLVDIRRKIEEADAALVYAPPQLSVREYSLNRGFESRVGAVTPAALLRLASPWNQVEAGIAFGLDKPLLVVRRNVTGGVLDLTSAPPLYDRIDLGLPGALQELTANIQRWCQQQKSLPG